MAFTCVLHLLWRAFPRVQKAVVGAYSLLAALYYPFGQAYGALNFNTLLALHATNVEESTGNPDHLPVVQLSAGGLHLRSRGHCGSS
ncbi:hypothetical protein LNO88_08295 [Klebsiella pneumoniae subsp. pneumoniae]|nr:hypothetical protein [Klebsiella pneumoniae subsp. pneumoniae]